MNLSFFKYQGAGNDFILIDNRQKNISLETSQIQWLCDRHFGIGADGLILLENSEQADFKMVYFNSDGKESTMCGNGGRCIVAFAKKLGIIPHNTTTFEAIDGLHYAETLQNNLIKLQMQNVTAIEKYGDDFVLNTGSPHYVRIVENIKQIDVLKDGRNIRYSDMFKEKGINVNFLEIINQHHILVRTYERGVENETLACGTGVTACALVLAEKSQMPAGCIEITTPGGQLKVEFEKKNGIYQNIFLTGNADEVFKGEAEVK
ncbi:MAG: diaminopimelate epimerase [Bacteroidia bacterium]|nr:MAG: diaminopimelate epimerase [Bacteroidia bacterium]